MANQLEMRTKRIGVLGAPADVELIGVDEPFPSVTEALSAEESRECPHRPDSDTRW